MTRASEPQPKRRAAGMRRSLVALPAALLLCTSLPAAPPPERAPLVFAAASLTDALREAANRFRLEGGGDVRFHLGGSEALATQILAGAPADLFFSASPNAMNRVQLQGLVVPGTRRDLLRNRIVVVAPRDRARPPLRDLIDIADARFAHIAIGDPATVPAGRYANEALVRSGVWDTIAPRLIPATDVRAALAFVATGEADLGVVYATDARVEPRVGIVLEIPEELHSPILYPAALMRRAAFLEPARQFLRYLSEPEGLTILARAGFAPTVDLPAAAEEAPGAGRAAVRAAPVWLAPVLISLRVAALSVLIGLPFALLFARLLTRRRFPGLILLETLLNLPLVLPPVATGYALLLLLSREGPLGPLWRQTGISLVFSWPGAAVAAAVIAFPLMLRAAQVAFESIDPRLPSLARTLGASRLRAFRTVTLPLAFPGVLAAALIGFARALGEFGATMMVAGNIPGATQTLPLAIFTAVQVGSGRPALVLCGLSALLALGTLAAARLIEQVRRDRRGS